MEKLIGKYVVVKGYEEYGVGIVTEVVNEEYYPVVVEFNSTKLHESEQIQYFAFSQIVLQTN